MDAAKLNSLPVAADLPQALALLRSIGRTRAVHFRAPPTSSPSSIDLLISALKRELVDHTVFANGVVIAAIPVVETYVIMEHAPSFSAAAVQFRAVATDLVAALLLRLSLGQLHATSRLALGRRTSGSLLNDWQYSFHGFECCFTNTRTAQILDVQLEFDGEYGALDPYFFNRFIETTPGFNEIVTLLPHRFHDTARVLDVLVREGYLATIRSSLTGQIAPIAHGSRPVR